jgi:hypothetical protein
MGHRFSRHVLPLKEKILNPVIAALGFGDLSHGKSRSLGNSHLFPFRS